MNSLLKAVRNTIRRIGFDLVRYPIRQPFPLIEFLKRYEVDTVLDVGANVGQYATLLRRYEFSGQILSFEPNPDAFRKLQENSSGDKNWICFDFALGSEEKEDVLHMTENSSFSSLLHTTGYIETLCPRSRTQRREMILVRTLDRFWGEKGLDANTVFLKIDTQGYEKQVILGASHCLDKIIGIQMEMSLHRVYINQPQLEEMIPFMRGRGFHLYAIWDGFSDQRTGQRVEVDGLFFKISRDS